jgi:hypothetical protein
MRDGIANYAQNLQRVPVPLVLAIHLEHLLIELFPILAIGASRALYKLHQLINIACKRHKLDLIRRSIAVIAVERDGNLDVGILGEGLSEEGLNVPSNCRKDR